MSRMSNKGVEQTSWFPTGYSQWCISSSAPSELGMRQSCNFVNVQVQTRNRKHLLVLIVLRRQTTKHGWLLVTKQHYDQYQSACSCLWRHLGNQLAIIFYMTSIRSSHNFALRRCAIQCCSWFGDSSFIGTEFRNYCRHIFVYPTLPCDFYRPR